MGLRAELVEKTGKAASSYKGLVSYILKYVKDKGSIDDEAAEKCIKLSKVLYDMMKDHPTKQISISMRFAPCNALYILVVGYQNRPPPDPPHTDAQYR